MARPGRGGLLSPPRVGRSRRLRLWSTLDEGHALALILEADRRVAAVLALFLGGGQRGRVADGDVPLCNRLYEQWRKGGAVSRVGEQLYLKRVQARTWTASLP